MFANCQNKFIHQKCLFQSFILNGRGPGAERSFVEAGGVRGELLTKIGETKRTLYVTIY